MSTPADAAFAAVERARMEVNRVSTIMATLDNPSTHASASPTARQAVRDKIAQQDRILRAAEAQVEKSREKLRTATVGRHFEGVDGRNGADLALAVISDGPEPVDLKKRERPGRTGAVLRRSDLTAIAGSFAVKLGIAISLDKEQDGLKVCVGDVFQAGLWFVDEESENKLLKSTGTSGFCRPECATVCHATEEKLHRFRSSKFDVFKILQERASAAIQHYWSKEDDPEHAIERFLVWLSLHKTVFKDKSVEDDRLLAFDSSRGCFLPACVRSFEGSQAPRHPRTCIPPATSERVSGSSDAKPSKPASNATVASAH